MSLTNKIPEILKELDPAVRAALVRSAQGIVQDAKDRVPVETGRLRDAIHWEPTEEGISVIAGDQKVFYGHMVEHGSVHNAPRPFLVPALEQNRDEIERNVAEAVRKVVG